MTMRTVAWLGAVAVLLAGFVLYDLARPTTGQRQAGTEHLVAGFDRRTVERVTITHRGEAPFSLIRQPPGNELTWAIDPGARRADDAAVEDLLTAIDFAETERTADVTPEAAGLAPPATFVALDTHTIRIGRGDASGRGAYVQVDGARDVRVAPARLRDLAGRDASAFRDRRLFAFAPEAMNTLTWTDPSGRSAGVGKQSTGRWKAVGTAHAEVANDRVEEALRRLAALRADSYRPASAPGAPTQPRLSVGVPTGGAVVTIGGPPCPNGGVAVVRTGPEGIEGACLPPDALAAVWPALAAAAEPDLRLLAQPPEGVTRVELLDGDQRLVLARERGWRFVTPAVAYPADPSVIADWLGALHRTRRDPTVGPKHRSLRVEGRYPELTDVSGPKEAYALLAPDPLRFRDRAVLSFAHFDVRRLRRTVPGAPAVEGTTSDGDLWQPPSIDRANAVRLASALGDLHATAFLAKAPAPRPQVTLEVDVQAPGDPKPIHHTLAINTDCTALLDGAVAFLVAAPACGDLKLPLVSPSGP